MIALRLESLGSLKDARELSDLVIGQRTRWGSSADCHSNKATRIRGCESALVAISKEAPKAGSESVHRGRFLHAPVAACSRLWRCQERGYILVRNLGNLATVANLVRPVRKQTNMPPILADSAGCTTICFELDDELPERLCDLHGRSPWRLSLDL